MPRKITKFIALSLCFVLAFQQTGFAQVAAQLDIAGHLASLHSSISLDKFRPLHLRYLSYDGANNNFKLLLDKGDADIRNSAFRLNHSLKTEFQDMPLQQETKVLLNYFFTGVTLPNSSFWVNLRPDSPDNIIDEELAKTDLGRVLLEADLELKKDTAKLTSPETALGRSYWSKLYKKAEELFGTENITIPTLTRPWIVPAEIILRESKSNAYIYKATLKVLLEEDYLGTPSAPDHQPPSVIVRPTKSAESISTFSQYSSNDPRLKALNAYAAELARELIIPKLNKAVNSSKRYAALRQVYYSLILAQWFKARFRSQSNTYISLIDSKNLTNLTSKASWDKDAYFKEYQKSFKDGEYHTQETVYTPTGQAIRSYTSGGVSFFGEGGIVIPDAAPSPGQTVEAAGGRIMDIGIGENTTPPEFNGSAEAEVKINPVLPYDIQEIKINEPLPAEKATLAGQAAASPVEAEKDGYYANYAREALVKEGVVNEDVIENLITTIAERIPSWSRKDAYIALQNLTVAGIVGAGNIKEIEQFLLFINDHTGWNGSRAYRSIKFFIGARIINRGNLQQVGDFLASVANKDRGVTTLEALTQIMKSEEINDHGLAEGKLDIDLLSAINEKAGDDADHIFLKGLPILMIFSPRERERVLDDLIKILGLTEGAKQQTISAINDLFSLLKKYPASWNSFIKPVVFNQTQGAYLCFEAVKKLYDLKAVESQEDLVFLKEFIEAQGIRAYDLLNNFLAEGIKRGVIDRPLSKGKDAINEFLGSGNYPILELYEAYRDNPQKAQELKERCQAIHAKIVQGDARDVEGDPLFGAMLYYAFPPAVTTQREQYNNLYKQRPDRPQDTAAIPSALQGKRYSVSTGRYALKNPAKPLDETSWKTILDAVQMVNREGEGKPVINEEGIIGLGGKLLEDWQTGSLYTNRKELFEKLYRYFRYSRGQVLPDSLATIESIMSLKQFIGDTLRDLIDECVVKFREKDSSGYQAVINRMLKTKIENPRGTAQAIFGILGRFKDNPGEAKQKVSQVLRIDDSNVLDRIWSAVKDSKSADELTLILKDLTFEIQPGKEAAVISHLLQGNEYKTMQSEVSVKYEFHASQEQMKVRFITSKRKAHGVAGFNMGVCIVNDGRLWDRGNFMNVIIFSEDNIAQGGMHVLVIEDGSKRYLVLPGINPSVNLLSRVGSEEIYQNLIAYAIDLAKSLDCQAVLIPTAAVIHSNRSEIQRVIGSKQYNKIPLSEPHQFSYSPSYSFDECFIAATVDPFEGSENRADIASSPLEAQVAASPVEAGGAARRKPSLLRSIAGPVLLSALSIFAPLAESFGQAQNQGGKPYKEALVSTQRMAEVNYYAGIGSSSGNDFKSAIEYFRKAVELNPQYAKAYLNLGISYYKSNNRDAAVNAFKEALRLQPELSAEVPKEVTPLLGEAPKGAEGGSIPLYSESEQPIVSASSLDLAELSSILQDLGNSQIHAAQREGSLYVRTAEMDEEITRYDFYIEDRDSKKIESAGLIVFQHRTKYGSQYGGIQFDGKGGWTSMPVPFSRVGSLIGNLIKDYKVSGMPYKEGPQKAVKTEALPARESPQEEVKTEAPPLGLETGSYEAKPLTENERRMLHSIEINKSGSAVSALLGIEPAKLNQQALQGDETSAVALVQLGINGNSDAQDMVNNLDFKKFTSKGIQDIMNPLPASFERNTFAHNLLLKLASLTEEEIQNPQVEAIDLLFNFVRIKSTSADAFKDLVALAHKGRGHAILYLRDTVVKHYELMPELVEPSIGALLDIVISQGNIEASRSLDDISEGGTIAKAQEINVSQLRDLASQGDCSAVIALSGLARWGNSGAQEIVKDFNLDEFIKKNTGGDRAVFDALQELAQSGHPSAGAAAQGLIPGKLISKLKQGDFTALAELEGLAARGNLAAKNTLNAMDIRGFIDKILEGDNAIGLFSATYLSLRNADTFRLYKMATIVESLVRMRGDNNDINILRESASKGSANAVFILNRMIERYDFALAAQAQVSPDKFAEKANRGDKEAYWALRDIAIAGNLSAKEYLKTIKAQGFIRQALDDGDWESVLVLNSLAENGNVFAKEFLETFNPERIIIKAWQGDGEAKEILREYLGSNPYAKKYLSSAINVDVNERLALDFAQDMISPDLAAGNVEEALWLISGRDLKQAQREGRLYIKTEGLKGGATQYDFFIEDAASGKLKIGLVVIQYQEAGQTKHYDLRFNETGQYQGGTPADSRLVSLTEELRTKGYDTKEIPVKEALGKVTEVSQEEQKWRKLAEENPWAVLFNAGKLQDYSWSEPFIKQAAETAAAQKNPIFVLDSADKLKGYSWSEPLIKQVAETCVTQNPWAVLSNADKLKDYSWSEPLIRKAAETESYRDALENADKLQGYSWSEPLIKQATETLAAQDPEVVLRNANKLQGYSTVEPLIRQAAEICTTQYPWAAAVLENADKLQGYSWSEPLIKQAAETLATQDPRTVLKNVNKLQEYSWSESVIKQAIAGDVSEALAMIKEREDVYPIKQAQNEGRLYVQTTSEAEGVTRYDLFIEDKDTKELKFSYGLIFDEIGAVRENKDEVPAYERIFNSARIFKITTYNLQEIPAKKNLTKVIPPAITVVLHKIELLENVEVSIMGENRINIRIKEERNLEKSKAKIVSLLEDTDLFWVGEKENFWADEKEHVPYSYSFWVYPNVKRQQIQIEREIEPKDNTVVVFPGEWAVTNASDENYKLATEGMGPCKGVLIYNPYNETASIAHINLDNDHAVLFTVKQMLEAVDVKEGKGKIQIWLTDNLDEKIKSLIIRGLDYKGVLPRGVIFDSRKNEINEIPDIEWGGLERFRHLPYRLDDLRDLIGLNIKVHDSIPISTKVYFKTSFSSNRSKRSETGKRFEKNESDSGLLLPRIGQPERVQSQGGLLQPLTPETQQALDFALDMINPDLAAGNVEEALWLIGESEAAYPFKQAQEEGRLYIKTKGLKGGATQYDYFVEDAATGKLKIGLVVIQYQEAGQTKHYDLRFNETGQYQGGTPADPMLASLTEEIRTKGYDTKEIPAKEELTNPLNERIKRHISDLTASGGIRWGAARNLIEIGQPAVESLIGALRNRDSVIRSQAAEILGKIGDIRAYVPLKKVFDDDNNNYDVRKSAWVALDRLVERGILPEVGNKYRSFPVEIEKSKWQRALVYGSGGYWYWQNKAAGINIPAHEFAHSLAAWGTGAGVKEYSVLPPVIQYEEEYDSTKGGHYVKRDAAVPNVLFSLGRFKIGGIMAYMDTQKKTEEQSRIEQIIIPAAPYALDMGLMYLFSRNRELTRWSDERQEYALTNYGEYAASQMGAAPGAAIFSLLGSGDTYLMAQGLIQGEGWPKEAARRLLGLAIGSIITVSEMAILESKLGPDEFYRFVHSAKKAAGRGSSPVEARASSPLQEVTIFENGERVLDYEKRTKALEEALFKFIPFYDQGARAAIRTFLIEIGNNILSYSKGRNSKIQWEFQKDNKMLRLRIMNDYVLGGSAEDFNSWRNIGTSFFRKIQDPNNPVQRRGIPFTRYTAEKVGGKFYWNGNEEGYNNSGWTIFTLELPVRDASYYVNNIKGVFKGTGLKVLVSAVMGFSGLAGLPEESSSQEVVSLSQAQVSQSAAVNEPGQFQPQISRLFSFLENIPQENHLGLVEANRQIASRIKQDNILVVATGEDHIDKPTQMIAQLISEINAAGISLKSFLEEDTTVGGGAPGVGLLTAEEAFNSLLINQGAEVVALGGGENYRQGDEIVNKIKSAVGQLSPGNIVWVHMGQAHTVPNEGWLKEMSGNWGPKAPEVNVYEAMRKEGIPALVIDYLPVERLLEGTEDELGHLISEGRIPPEELLPALEAFIERYEALKRQYAREEFVVEAKEFPRLYKVVWPGQGLQGLRPRVAQGLKIILSDPIYGKGIQGDYVKGKIDYFLYDASGNDISLKFIYKDSKPERIFKIDLAKGQIVEAPALPEISTEISAYPNPFSPETGNTIVYGLARDARVKVEVFNTSGRKVNTLLDEIRLKGQYSVSWKGTTGQGEPLAAGIYIIRMTVKETGSQRVETKIHKTTLIRSSSSPLTDRSASSPIQDNPNSAYEAEGVKGASSPVNQDKPAVSSPIEERELETLQAAAKDLVGRIRPKLNDVKEKVRLLEADTRNQADTEKIKRHFSLILTDFQGIAAVINDFTKSPSEAEIIKVLQATVAHEMNNKLAPLISLAQYIIRIGTTEEEDVSLMFKEMTTCEGLLSRFENIKRIVKKSYSPSIRVLDLEASSVAIDSPSESEAVSSPVEAQGASSPITDFNLDSARKSVEETIDSAPPGLVCLHTASLVTSNLRKAGWPEGSVKVYDARGLYHAVLEIEGKKYVVDGFLIGAGPGIIEFSERPGVRPYIKRTSSGRKYLFAPLEQKDVYALYGRAELLPENELTAVLDRIERRQAKKIPMYPKVKDGPEGLTYVEAIRSVIIPQLGQDSRYDVLRPLLRRTADLIEAGSFTIAGKPVDEAIVTMPIIEVVIRAEYGRRGLALPAQEELKEEARILGLALGVTEEGKIASSPVGAKDGELEPSVMPAGRFTLGTTAPGRNIIVDDFIDNWLKENNLAKAVIVDLGPGYLPVTTVELARRFLGRAKVIAVDINVPAYTLEFKEGDEVFLAYFNEKEELYHIVAKTGIYEYYDLANKKEKPKVEARAIDIRDEFMERARKQLKEGKPEFIEGTTRLSFEPVQRFVASAGLDNLSLVKGGFELPIPEEADIIRAVNVFLYYDATGAQEAIKLMGAKLKEGGIIIISNSRDSLIFQKVNGEVAAKEIVVNVREFNTYDDLRGNSMLTLLTIAAHNFFGQRMSEGRRPFPEFERVWQILNERLTRVLPIAGFKDWPEIREAAGKSGKSIDEFVMQELARELKGSGLEFYLDSRNNLHVKLQQVMDESGKGGIDLRVLPAIQPMAGAQREIAPVPLAQIEMSPELEQMMKTAHSGFIISAQHIKDYLEDTCRRKEFSQEASAIISCFADILRLQEAEAISTDTSLKQMLALVESDKSDDDMQKALDKIAITPREPAIIGKKEEKA